VRSVATSTACLPMGNTMVCFVHKAFFLLEIRCRSVIFFISTPTNLKVFEMASESEKEFEAQGRTDVIAELKDKLANQEVCSS
jgi:hypothetical protein